MATDKFTPETREALARCYRILLQLPDKRESETANDAEEQTSQVDIIEADGLSGSKEVTITNENA